MKVLILSTYEHTGGAAIAASRLMSALRKNGVEVTMLCRRNITWGPRRLRKQSWTSIMERLVIWVHSGFNAKSLWTTDIAMYGQDVTKTKEYEEADVIHLHWVNQGFLSFDTIEKIVKSGKRVVWTMHDAWNSTGCCHLTLGCEKYKAGCEQCEHYDCRRYWQRKHDIYSQSDIHFVTCSKWLKSAVDSSSLMNGQKVTAIPNPIDSEEYSPKGKTEARKSLNLPTDKHIVLFAALNVNDAFKGMKYLIDAMQMLDSQVAVMTLGNNGEAVASLLGDKECYNQGYVSDKRVLQMIYNAADVFLLPSLSENLPNTIMEAMACGTPCVGFEVGGIPEMIDHKQNGYVARYKDAADLAEGIRYVLDNREELGSNAREKVMREYREEIVAKKYIEIYNA